MNYKRLGQTGVKVSSLCMGTMTFGREADRTACAAMYKRCRDAGINFFDCANLYAGGESEKILGESIAADRDEVVITSKVYYQPGPGLNPVGLSRRHMLQAVEASLKRLKTDRIDLYFLHHFDEHTPLEETLRALEDLVTQGKVVYTGASNFSAWQIAKALGISERHGWNRFQCIQPMYNLVKRQAEVELLPLAQAERLGVITYSPLGGGLLTGKYADESPPAAGRLLKDTIYRRRFGEEWVKDVARRYTSYAKGLGLNPVALALAWVAHHPAVTAPIIGARNLTQLEDALASLDISMTPELHRELSSLSPAPPLATDRNDELAE
ncbi:MAG TPA: aldo/keto reductase [Verrucomicrobia bacterium]|nr:aldo/keto reductase [Verrucomicrobiota bacterium]